MKNPTIVFTIIDGATTVANNGIYISIAKAPNAIAVKIKTDPLINVPINDIIKNSASSLILLEANGMNKNIKFVVTNLSTKFAIFPIGIFVVRALAIPKHIPTANDSL